MSTWARSGRLRRPGRGLNSDDQSNPKAGHNAGASTGRFRLIVDDWATFNPRTCVPPQTVHDHAETASTIRLIRASTIAEIRNFWACTDRRIAEATGCRIGVQGIAALFAKCVSYGIVHPNAPLAKTPWGNHEFAILDPDGNLITFYEPVVV